MAQRRSTSDITGVKEGTRVMASDGPAGQVREVLIGETPAESYLRVRTGIFFFGKERYVGGHDVERVDESAVWLKVTRRALEATTAQTRPRDFVQAPLR